MLSSPLEPTSHIRTLWHSADYFTCLSLLHSHGILYADAVGILLGKKQLHLNPTRLSPDAWTPPSSYPNPNELFHLPPDASLTPILLKLSYLPNRTSLPSVATTMNYTNGWLDGSGTFYPCHSGKHKDRLASLGYTDDTLALKAGFVKLHLSILGAFVLFDLKPTPTQHSLILQWHRVHHTTPEKYLALYALAAG